MTHFIVLTHCIVFLLSLKLIYAQESSIISSSAVYSDVSEELFTIPPAHEEDNGNTTKIKLNWPVYSKTVFVDNLRRAQGKISQRLLTYSAATYSLGANFEGIGQGFVG